MSFINKVKNFFYEDVEEDDEEFDRREALKREEKLRKKEEKENKKIFEEKQKQVSQVTNNDLSERELFKSEKTFNFPMDIGDDIFDLTETMPSRQRKEETRKAVKEEKNLYARSSRNVTSTRKDFNDIKKETEEPKKFRPTPVVSPIYGILDKNYTVDDVTEKEFSKTKEFSIEKKIVDFDTVRNRAYKELDEEIEKTLTKKNNFFYNLEDDEKGELNTGTDEDYVEEAYDKNENSEEEDVIITYDGVEEVDNTPDVEEEEEDFEMPDVEIPKKVKKSRKKEEKQIEEDEEKEDLFNLIDNMYNDEEDEEEDD